MDGQGDPENWQFNCNSSVGDRIVSANKLTPATAFFNPRNNLKAIQVQILNPSYTNRQIEQVATLSKRNLNAFLMKGVSPIVKQNFLLNNENVDEDDVMSVCSLSAVDSVFGGGFSETTIKSETGRKIYEKLDDKHSVRISL